MITSDKQYKAAQQQLIMLQSTLTAPMKNDVPEAIQKAAQSQLHELIAEITGKMKEYDELVKTHVDDKVIEIHSLDDLLLAPIRYRLASHMSVESFGRKVDVSARQIVRYEEEEYQNINVSTFRKILKKLNIHIDGKISESGAKTEGIWQRNQVGI